MHPRTAIRHALVAHLGQPVPGITPPSYRTAARDSVFSKRSASPPAGALPLLIVSTDEDKREAGDPASGGGPLRRQLTVMVEGSAAGEGAGNAIDALSLEVEDAVFADPTLGGLLESLRWEKTLVEGVDEDTGVTVRMTFSAVYHSHLPPEGGPPLPTRIYGSWEPDTGPSHLPDYREMSDGRPPEIV
ncbi:hypothetical protein ACIU1J_02135 [Azospirillum doebereinerae]|uniref:hypothetical protein n=1 Tax=Azospirillum doebereinerae TaxID=92933 RepID=UPI001EE61A69|nr:hypothetical protein [Azospirillum doebereinerae]MCG5240449.1 hypothetical protein [Azospirillum doebereinerae]